MKQEIIKKVFENNHLSCGVCESQKNLMIHHNDKNRNNNSLNNLKLLCKKCHRNTHNNRSVGNSFCETISFARVLLWVHLKSKEGKEITTSDLHKFIFSRINARRLLNNLTSYGFLVKRCDYSFGHKYIPTKKVEEYVPYAKKTLELG